MIYKKNNGNNTMNRYVKLFEEFHEEMFEGNSPIYLDATNMASFQDAIKTVKEYGTKAGEMMVQRAKIKDADGKKQLTSKIQGLDCVVSNIALAHTCLVANAVQLTRSAIFRRWRRHHLERRTQVGRSHCAGTLPRP
jgi:hypothetical protein